MAANVIFDHGDVSDNESVATRSSRTSISTTGSVNKYIPRPKREALARLLHQNRVAEAEVAGAELDGKLTRAGRWYTTTMNLPFFLGKDKMAFLHGRFPMTRFVSKQDNAHDHPIAHTETMIATAKALRLCPEGSTIVDMYGSPKDMEAFNRSQARARNPKHGMAYVGLMTPKDYLRSLKWGPQHDGEQQRYIRKMGTYTEDFGIEAGSVQMPFGVVPGHSLVWFFKHSLYYLSDEEIQELLNVNQSRILAVVHRHPNESGNMFAGECSYAKKDTVVHQVNSLTGESYCHRDLSWLWNSTSKVVYTSTGAFTWTFHMISEDTWIIELVAIPQNLDERFAARAKDMGINGAAQELNEHSLAPLPFQHPAVPDFPEGECTMVGGVPIVTLKDTALPSMRITCPELYEFLKTAIAGKPRDPERLADLFSTARSHLLNASEFPGKRSFAVAADDIAHHVMLAFVAGVRRETLLLRGALLFKVWTREHKALTDGAALVGTTAPESAMGSVVSLAKRVNNARKRGDTFDGILESLE